MQELDAGAGGTDAVSARGWRTIVWAERHALLVCLPLQALLLFVDLGRLPVWGDEQTSLDRAVFGIVPANTVHPGFYFLVLHGWLAALGDAPSIVAARALSALFVLAATLAIDRYCLRWLEPRTRLWFLILWTLSPALLLYGRMARSYSLQVLLAVLALSAGAAYARRAAPRSLLAYAATITALLYTHYLPGIAVAAGVFAAMAWRALADRRPPALGLALLPLILIGLASVPWFPRFSGALTHVAEHSGYHVIGPLADIPLALAFTAVSFSVGESLWSWTVPAVVVLLPLLATLLVAGVRVAPPWRVIVGIAAIVGFIGAYQWVSYAFVAARLLFLLPFYLLLLVLGARERGRLGEVACAIVALLSVAGIAAYFAQTGFLNQAYVLPSDAIAEAIRADSPGASDAVILDHHGTDLSAVAARLPHDARVVYIADAASAARAIDLAADPAVRQAWFARSTHDVSPQQWNDRVIDAFARGFSVRRTSFAPYSALDRWFMRLAGRKDAPRYAIELVEMRRGANPGEPFPDGRRDPDGQ